MLRKTKNKEERSLKTYRSSSRIAVIGYGADTPLGTLGPGDESLWESLKAGKTAIRPFPFDPSEHKIEARVASDHRDFDFLPYARLISEATGKAITGPTPPSIDRSVQMGLASTFLASQMAGIDLSRRQNIGFKGGTGLGGGRSWGKDLSDFTANGRSKRMTFTVVNVMHNALAGFNSIIYGFTGPSSGTSAACASSGQAIADACDQIRLGRIPVMVAIGSEAVATPFQIACFDQLKALSRSNDPLTASQPFGKNRSGFVMGEGAGTIILADWDWAIANKKPILAEILGYATNSGANNIVEPHAEGAAECMELALEDAEVPPEMIDYINTHGTATGIGDLAEAYAIWKVFCANTPYLSAPRLPIINSTKALTGHTLGAAGVLEVIITILSLRDGIVHPMGDYELDPNCLKPAHQPDETEPFDLTLPIVTAKTEAPLKVGMSTAFGFGDHNFAVIVARPDFQ